MGSQNNPSSAEAASTSTNPSTVPNNMQRQASQMSQMSGYESGGPYSASAQSAGTVRRISDAGDGARDFPGTYIPPLFFLPPDLVTRFDF